jgi:hypothetical protein
VARAELWIDGALVAVKEGPDEGLLFTLVLNTAWEPTILGPHTILVRAVSVGGIDGQATVAVEVVEAEAEQLAELDPEPEGDGSQPGDSDGAEAQSGDPVSVPDEAGDSEGEGSGEEPPSDDGLGGEAGPEPLPGDEVPPDPHDDAPDSDLRLIEVIGLYGIIPVAEEMVTLRVEALALETGGEYESVHCYIGIAGSDPRWYPDEDGDQSTDERFASLGDGSWNIADYLSGPTVPAVPWQSGQPLPIDITCVGMIDGGSRSVDLGRLEITVQPEAWDGITRRASSEGSFTLDYRVTQVGESASEVGKEIEIDSSMTPPSNLRLIHAGAGYFLGWEYEPDEEELPIDGFRIYLNDTLQWYEPSDSHFTALPDQWVHPPCGEEYDFKVTAYRGTYTDGFESPDSNVVSTFTGEIGDEGCGRAVIVTFETLTTGNLGGDGDRDPGDVGPVYGSIYVNDQAIGFNLRCDANLCDEIEGLMHNSEYSWPGLLVAGEADVSPQFVVEIPPDEESVQIGFNIMDEDTGRCRDSDDPGCPDAVCSGSVNRDVNIGFRGTINTSAPADALTDRCVVAYVLHPASGAPVVEPGESPPLPHLRVEQVTVGSDSGLPFITVRNVGGADWARHDLTIAVERPLGEYIGTYTWPELDLPPGEMVILGDYDLAPDHPMDICVILDPENQVAEEGEGTDWTERRYCQDLPDLIITDVAYESSRERLLVTVQNQGEGPVDHRDISLQVTLADGGTLSDRPVSQHDISLGMWDSAVLEWHGVGEDQREQMMEGYTVAVDYLDSIAETDNDNNEYNVPAGVELELFWTGIAAPYGVRNTVEFRFRVAILSGDSRRQLTEWHIPQGIDWDSPCNSTYSYRSCTKSLVPASEPAYNTPYNLGEFFIAGDEKLEIDVIAAHPGALGTNDSRETRVYGAENNWSAYDVGNDACGRGPTFGRRDLILGYSGDDPWSVSYYLCWKAIP